MMRRTLCLVLAVIFLHALPLHAEQSSSRSVSLSLNACTIMQLMGHSDIKLSLRYVRTTDPTLRTAVEAMTIDFRSNV